MSTPPGTGPGGLAEPVIPCVGAVVHDGRGRLLLVRRGRDPGRGLWSIPGGRVEACESDEAAVVREVGEETGLAVDVVRFLGTVHRPAPTGGTYEIRDFLAALVAGAAPEPVAGDDAAAVRWAARADLEDLPLVAGLLEALEAWQVLPE